MTGSPVRLSELLGRPVLGPGHHPLGRLVELTVVLGAPHPVVGRVGLGSGRRIAHLVSFAGVDVQERSVHATGADGRPPVLNEGEVRLLSDVLDTQVVDLGGHRLCRVSDVVLVSRSDGQTEVAAVDVGFGGILRRIGLRRLGARLAPVLVDWADLHLTSSRGHLVQLSTATSGMRRLDPHGVAELVARLSADQATDVLAVLDPVVSAAALGASHRSHRRRLLHLLPADTIASVTAAAPPDLRAHLIDAAGAPERRRHLRTHGWRLHRPPQVGPPPRGARR